MDNVFYLVSAHTSCIEGIRLSIKNKYVYITHDIVGFFADDEEDLQEKMDLILNNGQQRLENFWMGSNGAIMQLLFYYLQKM
ncbi:MAG: hypothetical protein Ct9H300mP21_06560 [Pseudomonadota bacterium]|nr:MAG: hypothetical protein Ct9H300mP21_06560 [Pseudomonadota bacterium]